MPQFINPIILMDLSSLTPLSARIVLCVLAFQIVVYLIGLFFLIFKD